MFYIYIPPQTPALDKGGACGKALPCTPKGVILKSKNQRIFITNLYLTI